jgi:integrase
MTRSITHGNDPELLEQFHQRRKSKPKSRFREQTGTVVRLSDGFYIRFNRDGENGKRTKVTERLCDLDTSAAKVKLLAASHMSSVNNARHTALKSTAPAPVLTVGAFWLNTYLPWVKANKRPSTADHYESDWRMYVRPELETTPINTYTTVDACELLDCLATKKNLDGTIGLNKSTLAHVKSLCSGIFSKACGTKGSGVTVNPWREAKVSVKVRPGKTRIAYTPEETVAILYALDKPDAKLFFALCAVMGMRPSEVAAVKWESITDGRLNITQAAPYGVLGDTKNERSKRALKLIEPVSSIITAWHEASGKPSTGLMFTNGKGEPVNSNSFAKYRIAPQAEKVCARWCGLYAGRHGTLTTLYNQTGDIRAAFQRSGNSLEVLQAVYVKPDVSMGDAGADVQEAVLQDAMKKALDSK